MNHRPECCPIHNAEPGSLIHYTDPGTRNSGGVAMTYTYTVRADTLKRTPLLSNRTYPRNTE